MEIYNFLNMMYVFYFMEFILVWEIIYDIYVGGVICVILELYYFNFMYYDWVELFFVLFCLIYVIKNNFLI